MNEKQTHLDWGFGLKWLLSCAVGTAVFGMVAFLSMWNVSDAVSEASNDMLGGLVAGAFFGGFLALGGTVGPGLLMRSKGVSPGRWIGFSVAASAIVMGVFFALAFSLVDNMGDIMGIVFVGLGLGLPLGLVQWQLLKQQGISAALWPLITIIGYTVAFSLVLSWSGEGREWLAIGGMGVVLGAVTGLGMMWLLRRGTAVATASTVSLLLLVLLLAACGSATSASSSPKVSFQSPTDGATVASPVHVIMQAENFTLEEAGEVHTDAGHLHIMIDTPCLAAGEVIPKDDTHKHFGDGSTEADLELTSGTHTLCLQAADGTHIALEGAGMTQQISITVP